MLEIHGLKLYSMQEAARYKGIEPELMRFYCRDGRGPDRQKLAGRWLFPQESLDAWDKEKVMKRKGRPHGKAR